MLGLQLLSTDSKLQAAIRDELRVGPGARRQVHDARKATTAIEQKRKLLDLRYPDKISPETFKVEEARLAAQLRGLREQQESQLQEHEQRNALRVRFEQVASFLSALDVDAIWQAATTAERRTLVEDLIDGIVIHPDRLVVQLSGAPPLLVTFEEVGLRAAGTKPSVSEGRRI